MTPRSTRRPLALSLLFAIALVAFVGCDTTDPVPAVEPDEVAGVYDFAVFRFNPQASAIDDADVLARLVPNRTSLELLNTQRGGQFQLRYQFEDELSDIISGDFTVSRDDVDLTVREEDRPSLRALLLSNQFQFERVGRDVLTLSATKTVNLEAFDPDEYGGAGLTEVQGVLEIELRLRVD